MVIELAKMEPQHAIHTGSLATATAMKTQTVHSLLIARSLLERARPLCMSEDRYLASAGLVVLQDSLEMAFYALLIELGVDDGKSLESKSFDELLAELKKADVPVPKSGTIKALNKQRVLTKHYAQVAEPVTVRNYLDTAEVALDAAVNRVIGRSVQELFLCDLLQDGESKALLKAAEEAIGQRQFLEALVEIRKVVFIEFELPYSIHGWKDVSKDEPSTPFGLLELSRGGWKAPRLKRNKEWIEANVADPTEYVQIDADEWRVQALEYGIHTAELANLRRLTPAVFRADNKSPWSTKYDASFPANEATEANAKYCLDRAISILLKKQEHARTARRPERGAAFDPPPVYIGDEVYKRATQSSEVVHTVAEGFTYEIQEYVDGFDASEKFFFLRAASEARGENGRPVKVVYGFLLMRGE
ncbi:hypothetical protein KAK07_24575 [Ideonella sp. 4Y16]|uniref:hypothetical protein n=1 Tax=Ideonella alba TaxID=2824118 RepID=UPI001B3872AE|nr:hypothetical protein [Ideonella alba]MBQ0946530.1 hypothetical protein [Ideonella alba]